jgi:hypothetical protein
LRQAGNRVSCGKSWLSLAYPPRWKVVKRKWVARNSKQHICMSFLDDTSVLGQRKGTLRVPSISGEVWLLREGRVKRLPFYGKVTLRTEETT